VLTQRIYLLPLLEYTSFYRICKIFSTRKKSMENDPDIPGGVFTLLKGESFLPHPTPQKE
jgi:hypothetical protein